ncbi:hypothetical protein [Salibacterium qingdaonense]|uniref:Uncharacterized protein n=1 Tax=Salibacterium qingdaonense TaxID=266892 RepID=A0A1I4QLY8_9BACI|nr:hypothetical protein [Salibacterium qingdaonense]SFM41059.1 hypothetical protein SAMN04488054_1455 [Salibacterium qingdaonense]
MKTAAKTATAFGTLKLPFSFDFKKNENEKLKMTAEYLLNELNIEHIEVIVTDIAGNKFHLTIHDHEVKIERVYED